jgi:enoyl-[acyl-carrier protein] reductase II
MLAAIILGASAVQVGTRFVASNEASSHINFKNAVINAGEGDTILSLKQLTPVRLLKNAFYDRVEQAERTGKTKEELAILLGKGRAKKGMFDGFLEEGELEIGQVGANVRDILPAAKIVDEVWQGFKEALANPIKMT